MKYFNALILILLMISLGSAGCQQTKKEAPADKSKTIKNDLVLVNKDGKEFNLSDYKGKTVILNFWASWCAPCVYEMPKIQEFYNNLNKSDVELILVALDQNFNRSISFMENNKYTMPYYKPTHYIPKRFDVSAIPITFILDNNGEIKVTYTGEADFTSDEFINAVNDVNNW